MLLCGVCFFKSKLPYLEKIGVKDSKRLTPEKRSNLTKLIKTSCVAYKELEISVKQIDDRELKRISLNQLEIKMMAEIINDLKPDIIFIDAADTNEKRFGELIRTILNYDPQKIISKHKADDLFPIVSAASIIAKTKRDKIINELREEYINKGYGDMGSGYTSDEKTVKFLREWIKTYKHIPPFARKTWETTKRIANQELYNRKITHYF